MNRTGNQRTIATGGPHALEVLSGQDSTARQQPDPAKATSQCLEYAKIDSASGTNPAKIQQQQGRDTRRDRLLSQAQWIRPGAVGILHGRMQYGVAQLEVQAEHDPRGADYFNDSSEIGKGVERLQANNNFARAGREHFECATGPVGAGVDQQRTGEASVELSQLTNQGPLQGTTLDRIQICDIALVHTQCSVEGTQECHWIPGMLRNQVRAQGRVPGSVARLCVYRNPAGQIEYRDNSHARYYAPASWMTTPAAVLGWDIGGVNTKVVRLQAGPDGLLGVGFILDALNGALPGGKLYIYSVDGRFVTLHDAREHPLAVAAANWAATGKLIARSIPTCVLLDIGTTTTDLIPIVDGQITVQGRTDPERLLSGELVYTGALGTPVEAVACQVPLWGGQASVAADGFAIIGDAHLWLGRLRPEDYTCPTPDGRPPSRRSAGDRLARVVCGQAARIAPAAAVAWLLWYQESGA